MLIGLTGPAGGGKDTIADYLVNNHRFTKIAFADPIKQALHTIFGWRDKEWSDREWKESKGELGFSPRRAAQTLGTEWGRELNKDLWSLLAERKIYAAEGSVVISDVRFENEANMIRSKGGVVVHVWRETKQIEKHSSEAGVLWLHPDKVIENFGDEVEELYAKVRVALDIRN